MASKTRKNDSAVRVRLSKAQIDVIAPGLQMLVESYRERVKKGSSRFAYPFRIYPPPRGFDRGVFNQIIMEQILGLEETLKANGNTRRWMEMDTFQLRAGAFAIRAHIDFVRSRVRQQRTFYRLKPKQRIQGDYLAPLRAKSERVIQTLERHMKRANRALLKAVKKQQYEALMVAWKEHLRWMRLHIAYYKPWGKPTHGRKKRQQRDLDDLMEMAKLAIRDEGNRAPGKKDLRNLMRLYARYARSGRRGYWSVRSLLENKDLYRAQWKLAQFVIDHLRPKELGKS